MAEQMVEQPNIKIITKYIISKQWNDNLTLQKFGDTLLHVSKNNFFLFAAKFTISVNLLKRINFQQKLGMAKSYV